MQIKNMEADLNAKSSDEKRPVEKYDQAKETISEVAALSTQYTLHDPIIHNCTTVENA